MFRLLIKLIALQVHNTFFLAFYHFRIAVAEYTIDGVPGMNMRPSWMKYPSVEANKSIDDCHHREYT